VIGIGAPAAPSVRWRWPLADEGAATLLLALWAVVLTTLALAGVVLTSVLATRTTAAAAADLGALAGASGVLGSSDEPCRRAARVARDNGARLVACSVTGAQVRVEVAAPAPAGVAWLLPGRSGVLRARAHAELVPAAGALGVGR
jgi:secretion/DNA translocation related TadE-like protein